MKEGKDIEKQFHAKLAELVGEISTLPEAQRARLTALAAKTQQRHAKLRRTVGELQESLDYLRLSIKYLVFDLEATRRENAYLRKMLDEAEDTDDAENDLDPTG